MCLLAAHLFKWKTAAASVMRQTGSILPKPRKKNGSPEE